MTNMDNPVIIGAGPGGLAAAMQLKRHGIRSLILEKDTIGGLLKNANLVENYPGFPGGIPGMALVQLFRKHAQEAGIQVEIAGVIRVDDENGEFVIETGEAIHRSRILVVASGTKPRKLPGLIIPAGFDQRVCYEVYPLLGLSGRRVAIIGAGDAAFDYALNLAQSNEVLILNRGQQVKCLPLLWERAQSNKSIQYFENTQVADIISGPVDEMILRYTGSPGHATLSVDYLIVAVGRDPQLDFFSKGVRNRSAELEEHGRLYYVGDVTNGIYRQTAIAVGEGILAAMKIYWRRKEILV
jgi:thioredoxin reductase